MKRYHCTVEWDNGAVNRSHGPCALLWAPFQWSFYKSRWWYQRQPLTCGRLYLLYVGTGIFIIGIPVICCLSIYRCLLHQSTIAICNDIAWWSLCIWHFINRNISPEHESISSQPPHRCLSSPSLPTGLEFYEAYTGNKYVNLESIPRKMSTNVFLHKEKLIVRIFPGTHCNTICADTLYNNQHC